MYGVVAFVGVACESRRFFRVLFHLANFTFADSRGTLNKLNFTLLLYEIIKNKGKAKTYHGARSTLGGFAHGPFYAF